MKRIALVVQRCHESIVGGSEALAWQYAQLLSSTYEVEMLSSCASDYTSWHNDLPAGSAMRDGIIVRRFPTAFERGSYFTELHRRLLTQFSKTASYTGGERIQWRRALQEEFIKFQGPYCPELVDHLRLNHPNYQAVLFFTYLYPTAYFGAEVVPGNKRIFIPTLHDEPTAYLSAFRDRAEEFADIIWLTTAESRVAARLWNIHHGKVVGMAVEMIVPPVSQRERTPYFLYCGRIDENKGSKQLLSAFLQLKKRIKSPLQLLLTGSKHMDLPKNAYVDFLGFVDERQKARLMADALAFVLPSEFESFSIVTLEAMAQGTPVIVNKQCDVLREHIEKSKGGYYYQEESGLVDAMERICQLSPEERDSMGQAGWRYVKKNYQEEKIRQRLVETVQNVIAKSEQALENPELLVN